jgi:hypothetical protein
MRCQWDIQVERSKTHYYLCEEDLLGNLFLASCWYVAFIYNLTHQHKGNLPIPEPIMVPLQQTTFTFQLPHFANIFIPQSPCLGFMYCFQSFSLF